MTKCEALRYSLAYAATLISLCFIYVYLRGLEEIDKRSTEWLIDRDLEMLLVESVCIIIFG